MSIIIQNHWRTNLIQIIVDTYKVVEQTAQEPETKWKTYEDHLHNKHNNESLVEKYDEILIARNAHKLYTKKQWRNTIIRKIVEFYKEYLNSPTYDWSQYEQRLKYKCSDKSLVHIYNDLSYAMKA